MKKIIPDNAILIPDGAKKVFEGVIFDTYQWSQAMFDDSNATFEMVRRPDTVSVIAVVDDKILVLDEEQPHKGAKKSFPGGRVDTADASTSTAAAREMLEETGYEFANYKLINVAQPQSKIEWFIYIYLASDPKNQTQPHLDAGEKITVRQLPFDEVKRMSQTGEGYLGESWKVFENLKSIDDLLGVPEFVGREVER